jgi:hypothetical protein
LFSSTHQAQAFREAVQTEGAKRVIGVGEQLTLAKEIMAQEGSRKHGPTASDIKKAVHERVEEGLKQQREIDKEEREIYLLEQIGQAIDTEILNVQRNLRHLASSLNALEDLARKYPGHPKIGGIVPRLDEFVSGVQRFKKMIK